jgi:hypothetical protein
VSLVLANAERAGTKNDKEGPHFRSLTPDGARLIRRHPRLQSGQLGIGAASHRGRSAEYRRIPPCHPDVSISLGTAGPYEGPDSSDSQAAKPRKYGYVGRLPHGDCQSVRGW